MIIQVAQFDLIDSETYIFVGIFDWEIPETNEEYHDEHLYEISYESTYTISNLGTLYIIFILFVVEGILLFLLKPVAVIRRNPCMKWH